MFQTYRDTTTIHLFDGLGNYLMVGTLLGGAIATPIAWLVTGSTKSTDRPEETYEFRPPESTVMKAEDWLDGLE
jgi:hypothetical protein